MINTSDERGRARAAKDTEARTKRRADQAQIVAGLQTILEADEQLLGFTRGVIAGGLRGKLTVGFEALFAPYVNIGLTERRVVLQHVQPDSGKPNEILPHSFPLSELHSIAFSDIETFGGEPAGRLNLRLFNDQHFRLRFREAEYVDNAKTIADVFSSLTASRPMARTSPTQSLCPHCDQILDRVSRFCPYCGQSLESPQAAEAEDVMVSDSASDSDAGDSPDGIANVETGSDSLSSDYSTTLEGAAGPEPEVETVAADRSSEMPTEGHEATEHSGDPQPTQTEGDRPL